MFRQEFYKAVERNGAAILPVSMIGGHIELRSIDRPGKHYMGAQIVGINQRITPVLNLDEAYDALKELDIPEALHVLSRQLERIVEDMEKQEDVLDETKLMDLIGDYSKMKERLFVACVPLGESITGQIPTTEKEGIRFVVRADVSSGCTCESTVLINQQLLNHFKVSKAQLFEDAFENMEKMYQPVITTLRERLLSEFDEDSIMDFSEDDIPPFYFVSSDRTVYGASMFFSPGIMEKVAEQIGGSYYILPSSIQEVLALSEDCGFAGEKLSEVVHTINDDHVNPEERLSNEAYHYDHKNGVFERAVDYEKRMEAIEKTKTVTPRNSKADVAEKQNKVIPIR